MADGHSGPSDEGWMLCCALTRQGGGRVVPFALHVRNDNVRRVAV